MKTLRAYFANFFIKKSFSSLRKDYEGDISLEKTSLGYFIVYCKKIANEEFIDKAFEIMKRYNRISKYDGGLAIVPSDDVLVSAYLKDRVFDFKSARLTSIKRFDAYSINMDYAMSAMMVCSKPHRKTNLTELISGEKVNRLPESNYKESAKGYSHNKVGQFATVCH